MNLSLSGFVFSFSARFQVPRVANVLIHALLALFIQFFFSYREMAHAGQKYFRWFPVC